MKKLFHTLIPAAMMMLTSCSTEFEEQIPSGNEEGMVHTVTMRLDGEIQHFDDDTRSVSSDWENNAKLYIQYQTASGKVSGVATYNKSSDEWAVSYYGSITSNVKTACEVYYFENTKETTLSTVTLNEISAVYFDSQATYIYKEGIVYLKTELKPKTGRLRFHGIANSMITITGLKWYSCYDINANTLAQQSRQIYIYVGSNGYTPYIYADFINTTTRMLQVTNDDEYYIFSKSFNSSVLSNGNSGYISVPTLESRNGWSLKELKLCPDNNHPHIIDMGTGVKFACCNIGANSPLEYGYYYAWGETETKSDYDLMSYKFNSGSIAHPKLNKYCNDSSEGNKDTRTKLTLTDDAARVNWGKPWRMPTNDELSNLLNSCTSWLTTINKVYVCKFIASNGNILFLPASGGYNNEKIINNGRCGYYWSSSLDVSHCWYAHYLVFYKSDYPPYYIGVMSSFTRTDGHSIRPVCE